LDIAPRSRGAIFMDVIVNDVTSVHLRVLYVSVVILRQAQDDNRQALDDNHGDTECTKKHGDSFWVKKRFRDKTYWGKMFFIF
jgi:hypothetical protein